MIDQILVRVQLVLGIREGIFFKRNVYDFEVLSTHLRMLEE